MTTHKRPVLLYEPRGPGLDLPVELLLASARVEDREVALVDGRFEVAPEGRVVERCRDAAMLVVSAPGGAALLDAERISRSARAARADLFVLWLGAHATARPDECLHGGADACAVGPVEDTLPELLAALDAGQGADAVPGLALPGAGGARLTPTRVGFGPPPSPARYDRLDLERHFRWRGERRVQYRSSRVEPGTGPPGAWRWAGLPADRVVAELAELVQKQRVAAVDFVDEEFFADLRRAEAIARGLLAAGARFAWTARGRVETLRLLTEDAVLALHQAGCERITVDAVSGSAAVRAMVPGAPDEAAVRELACKLARG
ncbi:MAG: cobalamin-dependent protein, partial [Vicinamibacteria bacterium]|nr:cobalamin-dependent protein [Vicinamibacteria bacterium]